MKAASGDAPTAEQKEEIDELVEIIKDFKERAEDSTGSEDQKKMVSFAIGWEKEDGYCSDKL